MKINTFLIGGIGVVCIVSAYLFYLQAQNPTSNPSTEVVDVLGEPVVTIVRTNEGYEPNDVTIKKGDIVLFTNQSKDFDWPASDLHPTHGIYPEFDPLKPIAPGGTWKFKFDKAGTWDFHDHIRANKVGSIRVTE